MQYYHINWTEFGHQVHEFTLKMGSGPLNFPIGDLKDP